jgi:hypothetical protein
LKKNYLKKILLLLTLFSTCLLFSQNDSQAIHVYYGNGMEISNGSTVDFGSSIIIEFTITNIPTTNGNPSLVLANPEVTIAGSNGSVSTDFAVLTRPGFNIKKGSPSTFKIIKLNKECGSGTGAVVTIHSNAKNYPDGKFTFILSYSNMPSISVLGGSTQQTVPNGQTVPTSTNGTLFGTIDVYSSTTRDYYIVNTGTCPLTLNSLTCLTYNPQTGLPLTDFTITYLSASTITMGGTALLRVKFTPQSAGLISAIISIPNNDDNLITPKNPYSFVVSGEGYNPTLMGPGGGVNADFRLWLKATRGINLATGTKVETWKDLGSLGKDAKQTTLANQPTFKDDASSNINFNPVVKFENNGTSISQFMYNKENGYYTQETFIVMEPEGAVGAPMTIISGTSAPKPATPEDPYPIVVNEHSGIGLGNFTDRLSNEKLWFNQKQTTDTPYYTVADALGDYTKAGIINTRNKTATASDGIDLLFNSNLITDNQTSISPSFTYTNLGYDDAGLWRGTPYNIGKNFNEPTYGNLNGRVAEVISYASLVPVIDRPRIETYLAIKYGITLGVNGSSQNYVNSGGTTIWNIAPENGFTFNYNIAGIGMDVGSDLRQKQSKSGNDINEVTIGLGVIAVTNSANINQFEADRNFLVWGSDIGTYTADGSNTTTLRSGLTTTVTKINKKWKIVETGGDVGNVFVGIPNVALSGLSISANEEYALIVSSEPAFADADIIDVIPLKSIGGIWQTWYDFDGTKYFTFGKVPKVVSKELVSIGAGNFLVGEYALNLKSGSFTIGCWLRNSGSTANKTIMAKGINLELRLNSHNKIEALWDGVSKFVSNTIINDGLWHNVVAVYYLGSANLYIDGVLDSSVFNLTNPSPNYSRYSVGALYVSKSDIRTPFNGEIDEIHIWDMALSSKQVNYLMNQEIEKYGADNTAKGKELPQNIASNEIKTIPWATLVAYYDFNSFYGTTVEGLTTERNFLRIKYLNKDKNLTGIQTAPLPYETIADGEWNGTNSSMWKNGALQTIPNGSSLVTYTKIVNGIPEILKYPIDGNIVKIKHNVTSTGNKTVLGLFVEGTDATTYKTLSANNDTKVQVSHYLKLDGLIDLKGHSQLVQTLNSELDVTSKGFIRRDQHGTFNRDNYNYWSSPVGPINNSSNNNLYTLNDVFKDGSTATPLNINWVSGYNGSPGIPGSPATPVSLARYWLYKFENGTEYADWIHFNETDQIRPSQGFTLKGPGIVDVNNLITQNYTFVGKPFNGLINGNIVKADNLFLVGNPYPSALNAFEFIKDNISTINTISTIDGEITGELYFWEHSPDNTTHILSGYTGGYATLTLAGGTAPLAPVEIAGVGASTKLSHQYIPVGQGFFVLGKPNIIDSPVIFNNNQRAFVKEDAYDDILSPISNTLFKNSAKNSKNKTADHFNDNSNDVVYNNYNTKIRLGFNTANNFHRQLLIGFMNENATDGLDRGYDGYQIDTQSNDSYFLINDLEYTIQGVGAFDVAKTYPLGVTTNIAGMIKFMIDDTEFLPLGQKIYVHDKETSQYYDITDKAAEINLTAGTFNSRFELTFKTDKSLATAQNELAESMLMIYNNEIKKKLIISKNQSVDIKEISIYNITGQRIFTLKEIPELNTIEIPFNVQHGAYVVKILTDKGIISKKVLKQ